MNDRTRSPFALLAGRLRPPQAGRHLNPEKPPTEKRRPSVPFLPLPRHAPPPLLSVWRKAAGFLAPAPPPAKLEGPPLARLQGPKRFFFLFIFELPPIMTKKVEFFLFFFFFFFIFFFFLIVWAVPRLGARTVKIEIWPQTPNVPPPSVVESKFPPPNRYPLPKGPAPGPQPPPPRAWPRPPVLRTNPPIPTTPPPPPQGVGDTVAPPPTKVGWNFGALL